MTIQELTGDVSGTIDLDTSRVGDRVSLDTVVCFLPPSAFELSPADGATTRQVLVLGRQEGLASGQVVQVAGLVRVLLDDEQAGAASPEQPPLHDHIVGACMIDTGIQGDDR